MERIDFLVSGSGPYPYQVSFVRADGVLVITCTCEAGINGMHCKHRTRIISGQDEDVVGVVVERIAEAAAWAAGTPITEALAECVELEAQAEEVKARRKKAKKRLAGAMLGRI
ncbi:MAG: hypothetical protein JWM59_1290 [Verrucomicrobiales bacterium]|nr:hypothetical protein [Verrucomicrobiales bacterium]